MDEAEITSLAIAAVATAFANMANPREHARWVLAQRPQLWAYTDALERMRAEGYKITKARSLALWRALGGN